MSETFDLFQQGKTHLKKGRAAQATVALEKAKRREPEKASIREALGIAYFRIHRYAEAAWDAAGRETAEEAYGDYQLVVDAIADRLLDLRESYAATLDPDTADAYRAAFAAGAARQFRRYASLVADLAD